MTNNMEGVLKAQKSNKKEFDLSVRKDIILEYVPLVKSVVHRIAARLPWHIEMDDLMSAGVIGLMDALEKFDLSKNTQFRTYAKFRIRGAILDELRSCDWVPRSIRRKEKLLVNTYVQLEQQLGRLAEEEEVAKTLKLELGEFQELLLQAHEISLISLNESNKREKSLEEDELSFEETTADPTGEDFLAKIYFGEVRYILSQAIADLPSKEKLVISLFHYEDLTMKEIGEVLELTRSRISQIHTKAILCLRKNLLNNKRFYNYDIGT